MSRRIKDLSRRSAILSNVQFVSEDRVDLPVSYHCIRCIYEKEECNSIMLHGCRKGQCGYWIRRN